MNKLILTIGLVALIGLGSTFIAPAQKQQLRGNGAQLTAEVIQSWIEFKKTHPRTFTDPDYEVYRMQIFANNLQHINTVNSQNLGYSLAINDLADISHEEFTQYYLGLKPELEQNNSNDVHVNNGLTAAVDWVAKGDVQAVKNQGQCGSCWAFSAIGSIESEYAVHGSGLLNLSEQQLVDCSTSFGNHGCNGGLMTNAFNYAKGKGLNTESGYPYTARDGKCQSDKETGTKISGFTNVKAGNTSDLQNALTQQPVAVAVDASNWQFYHGGVFKNCSTRLNHGVLLVGSDDSGNWTIKNSWGASWGEKGFITLATGNTCGLANMASYPKKA